MNKILRLIQTKKIRIGIVGLGYVGLPLAVLAAKKGFRVIGFARNQNKIDLLNGGESNIEAISKKDLLAVIKSGALQIRHLTDNEFDMQDVYIVCVPTPVDENKNPDLTPIRDIAKRLSTVSLNGKLIINESTVAPGTTREEFGNFSGKYFLAFSPERIDPGNHDKNVANIIKVIGGRDKESTRLTEALYGLILDVPTHRVSSLEAAETVKMLENTYRAVNIGLINEFARLSEKIGLDIVEIIDAAKTKWSYHAHYPSLGVGGHCIPVDPWYLVEYGKKKDVDLPIIVSGLKENIAMTKHIADKIASVYKKGMRVLVYGLTYKKDVNDLRESPALRLCDELINRNISFLVYDPLIPKGKLSGVVDIFIVGSDHRQLADDYRKCIGKNTIVIDGKNYFKKKVGQVVYGVGRTLV